ncbi:SAM-dependent methyltransferase [Nocardioides sp. Root614]|nr:SAM-dependent methyltransferase [Nocardioides sp. Root614]KRA86145.1 SAM-dependent methyltransferase [Nocardioides sp. Root682]
MSDVVSHYAGAGNLAAAIHDALTNAGVAVDGISTIALAPVDEFHVRGRAATLEIAEALAVDADSSVLDIGSGLGGPARTLAEVIGCRVTGIDLTPEFCATAAVLSEWTGLGDRTRFVVGDATALEFADDSFDAATTVHVAMNIADKAAMYREARRVLKPAGRFVVYDVLQGPGGDVYFPVPWAHDASTSHLATTEQMRGLLADAGFSVVSETDSSHESREWFTAMAARIAESGPPPVTFAAFLGSDFAQMARNQVANLNEDRIRTVTFVCQ